MFKKNQFPSKFLCICPQCHYGSLCQFSIEGIGFTLDSLINQVNRSIRIIYLISSFLIFFIGGVTNYANIVTFKRSNLRKSSMGVYSFNNCSIFIIFINYENNFNCI
jgi:hypothetical protein